MVGKRVEPIVKSCNSREQERVPPWLKNIDSLVYKWYKNRF